jgi:RNA polymerase sigma factor (sigma-70 family)
MDPFVRDLLALTPLTAADERALARRAQEGDAGARAALITAGMRAVALRALLLGFRGDEMRDAVQSGAIGLIRAVDRFDPDRGVRLATYSWHWIGSAMKADRPRDVSRSDREPDGIPALEADKPASADLLVDLPDELADVMRLRYGLGSTAAAPMTQRMAAQRLGLTVAQVRKREAKAMRHLRLRLAKVVHRAPPRGADPL